MNRKTLEKMSVDRLWTLHEQITEILTEKINAEKLELNQRLQRLSRGIGSDDSAPRAIQVSRREVASSRERRPYPRVLPKYRNPVEPSETWSGRGKMPRWLKAQIGSGRKIDDFRI